MPRTPEIKSINDIAKLFGVTPDANETVTLAQIAAQLEKVPYIPFPTAFHTVDVIALRNGERGTEVLLGKKPNKDNWVFIGGFVEPTHTAEHTASKEFEEEASLHIEEKRFRYLFSAHINDDRYIGSCHQITSSLFTVKLTWEESLLVKGGDDIELVQWFPLDELEGNLRPLHKAIFQANKEYLLTL